MIRSRALGSGRDRAGAQETGRSILLPRISPDGRWLLLSMCDYGCFPAYRKSSDLYLMDLQAPADRPLHARRLEINSDQSESWHSWSSNSRWIAFSSKRDNGLFTRMYLSYVDPNGVAHKPLVLPQKDPTTTTRACGRTAFPSLSPSPCRRRRRRSAGSSGARGRSPSRCPSPWRRRRPTQFPSPARPTCPAANSLSRNHIVPAVRCERWTQRFPIAFAVNRAYNDIRMRWLRTVASKGAS